jgi:hypothetical protein
LSFGRNGELFLGAEQRLWRVQLAGEEEALLGVSEEKQTA